MLTGGGSGGHITPILAIATELKKIRPDVHVVYVGQKGDSLADVPAAHSAIDAVYAVRAGKFRRYHGEGWRQIFDLKTQCQNARDALWVLAGIWQSFWLMRKLRPQLIFTRGGFVSVPVALGGKLHGIPYITHDSDSTPSLANRVIARWASLHVVALPADLYPYPSAKTVVIGVPVKKEYEFVTQRLQHTYRQELGLGAYKQVLLITGGGNGAAQLNHVVAQNARELLRRYPALAIMHIAGRALEAATSKLYDDSLSTEERSRVFVKGLVNDLYRYSGAADIIIARGGATGLAEFAMQHKACIIVPAKQLVWQTHHAKVLHKKQAIRYISEDDSLQVGALSGAVDELLQDDDKRHELEAALGRFAHPDAAQELAMLLLKQADTRTA